MDPDRRRAMIVAAALPLVVEYGSAVTTAKIARAAGIGEGTIFRVFPDKEALLAACLAEALNPDDTVAHLASIPLDQPLAARLTEAAELLRGRMERMGAVIVALAGPGGPAGRPPRPTPPAGTPPPDREAAMAESVTALAALFEPDAARLRLPPERLAATFHLLLMTAGRTGATTTLTTDQIVDLFLHGALA